MSTLTRSRSVTDAGDAAIRDEVAAHSLELAEPVLAGDLPVLDCGCSTGWWLARLRAHGVAGERLHGVEARPERVVAAAERAPRARVVHGDVRSLPYEDGSFGLVTAFTVLSRITDPDGRRRAIEEMRRVLAPDGLALVWEPRVPTPDRDRRRVPLRDLRPLGRIEEVRRLTVLPPLARRAPGAYRAAARLRPLRTHRLVAVRPSQP